MNFTSYEGGSTGNISFNKENVTSQLNTVNFENGDSFSFFPNPSEGQIEVLYENGINSEVKVAIYSFTGKKVYEKQLTAGGFYNEKLDLSHLSSGTYLIKFQSGTNSSTKKLIMN
jgi:hypothetical protein